jgi:tRNA G18 (ribose-2'-O)-methylase SpoU
VPVRVSDPADPRLDAFRWRERRLASRSERTERVGAGLFVAEGDLVVERALAAGREPVALLCEQTLGEQWAGRLPGVDVYVADEDLRREVTGLGVPLRATGLFRRPALLDAADLVTRCRRIVAFEAVDNPTNLGAVVRSAAALGWDGVLLDHSSADPLSRRALRVSMGTGLVVPFARLPVGDAIGDFLARHGAFTVALTPAPDALDIRTLDTSSAERVALLLGSERDGLRSDTLSGADVRARIPMHHGVDSLNVGAAAAIALHLLA